MPSFKIELEPLLPGNRVRFTSWVNDKPGLQRDMHTDLLYEAVTEETNNIIRRLLNQLEPKLRQIRKGEHDA